MIPATSGPPSPEPFAYFDPATSSLRTSQATFDLGFSEHSVTLPKWGSMRNGELYERRMQELRIVASASSSLLPTSDTVPEAPNTGSNKKTLPPGIGNAVKALLPTPAANDSGNTPEDHLRKKPGRIQVTSLQVLVEGGLIPTGGLLPTPTVGDAASTANKTAGRSNPNSKHHDGMTKTDWTRLLPTPRSSDSTGPGHHGTGGADLRTSIGDLTNAPSEDGSL